MSGATFDTSVLRDKYPQQSRDAVHPGRSLSVRSEETPGEYRGAVKGTGGRALRRADRQ